MCPQTTGRPGAVVFFHTSPSHISDQSAGNIAARVTKAIKAHPNIALASVVAELGVVVVGDGDGDGVGLTQVRLRPDLRRSG
jgi:hypothetical protein